MAVGVGNEHAVGFQQAQVTGVLLGEQAALGHAPRGGSPVVHLAHVFRVVHQERHHADAARRGTVKTLGLQKHTATGHDDAGVRRGQAGLRQRVQGQVLAHQQVAQALVGRGAAGGRKLHNHRLLTKHGTKLGLFAAGRRAGQRALHGLVGQGGVFQLGVAHAHRALRQGVQALQRGLAHHQVAGQVVTGLHQGFQHVVVAPVAQVGRQAQLGVGVGKGAAHEALGAHVVQKPGQAVVQLAQAVGLVHPEVPAGQRHHAAKRAHAALRVHPHHGHFGTHAVNMARQQVALRARRTHLEHLPAAHQRRQRPRHRGLAHAQAGLQLGAGGHTAKLAQGVQGSCFRWGGVAH